MKNKSILWIFFLTILSFSCQENRQCETGGFDLKITNLVENENDTIRIETYYANQGFSNLVRTKEFIFYDSLDDKNGIYNNVLRFRSPYHAEDHMYNRGLLSAVYDYRIITKNHTYEIANYEFYQTSISCNRFSIQGCPTCFNYMAGLTVNNQTTNLDWERFLEIDN